MSSSEVKIRPTTREVRERAAQLIERHGWCQWAGRRMDGAICAQQAIYDADRELCEDRYILPRTGFAAIIEVCEELGITTLAGWNDQQRRTVGDVLSALRGADDVI